MDGSYQNQHQEMQQDSQNGSLIKEVKELKKQMTQMKTAT
jgi:hypothetical protein